MPPRTRLLPRPSPGVSAPPAAPQPRADPRRQSRQGPAPPHAPPHQAAPSPAQTRAARPPAAPGRCQPAPAGAPPVARPAPRAPGRSAPAKRAGPTGLATRSAVRWPIAGRRAACPIGTGPAGPRRYRMPQPPKGRASAPSRRWSRLSCGGPPASRPVPSQCLSHTATPRARSRPGCAAAPQPASASATRRLIAQPKPPAAPPRLPTSLRWSHCTQFPRHPPKRARWPRCAHCPASPAPTPAGAHTPRRAVACRCARRPPALRSAGRPTTARSWRPRRPRTTLESSHWGAVDGNGAGALQPRTVLRRGRPLFRPAPSRPPPVPAGRRASFPPWAVGRHPPARHWRAPTQSPRRALFEPPPAARARPAPARTTAAAGRPCRGSAPTPEPRPGGRASNPARPAARRQSLYLGSQWGELTEHAPVPLRTPQSRATSNVPSRSWRSATRRAGSGSAPTPPPVLERRAVPAVPGRIRVLPPGRLEVVGARGGGAVDDVCDSRLLQLVQISRRLVCAHEDAWRHLGEHRVVDPEELALGDLLAAKAAAAEAAARRARHHTQIGCHGGYGRRRAGRSWERDTE
eukprot:scaffold5311_cov120-Isochrysis_galbana.AAC.6